jgi:hypothetical protein
MLEQSCYDVKAEADGLKAQRCPAISKVQQLLAGNKMREFSSGRRLSSI